MKKILLTILLLFITATGATGQTVPIAQNGLVIEFTPVPPPASIYDAYQDQMNNWRGTVLLSGGGVAPVTSVYDGITNAYIDSKIGEPGTPNNTIDGSGIDTRNAAFEFWINPDVIPTNKRSIIWELGGTTRGACFFMYNQGIRFRTKDGGTGNRSQINYDISSYLATTDYIQVGGQLTCGSSATAWDIYVNGKKVPRDIVSSAGNIGDWMGNNRGAIGERNDATGGLDDNNNTVSFSGGVSSMRLFSDQTTTYVALAYLQNYIATVGDYVNFDFDTYSPDLQASATNTIPASGDNNFVVRDTNATLAAANFTRGAIFVCGQNLGTDGILDLSGTFTNGYILLGNGGTLDITGATSWTTEGGIYVHADTEATIQLGGDLQKGIVVESSNTLNVQATAAGGQIGDVDSIAANTAGLVTNLRLIGGNTFTGNVLLGGGDDTLAFVAGVGGDTANYATINLGTGNDTLVLAGGASDNTASPTVFNVASFGSSPEAVVFATGAENSALDLTNAVIAAELGTNFTLITDTKSVADKSVTFIGPGEIGDNDFAFDYSGVTQNATFLFQGSNPATDPGITWANDHTVSFTGPSGATTTLGAFLFKEADGQTLIFEGGDASLVIGELVFSDAAASAFTADFASGATEFGGTVDKATIQATANNVALVAPAAGLTITNNTDILGAASNLTLTLTGTVNSDLNYGTPGVHNLVLAGTGSLAGDAQLNGVGDQNLTFTGDLTGAVHYNDAGNHSLTLPAASTISGGVQLNGVGDQSLTLTGDLTGDVNYNGAGNHSLTLPTGLTGALNLNSAGATLLNMTNVGGGSGAVTGGLNLAAGADVTLQGLTSDVLASITAAPTSTLHVPISDAGGEIAAAGDITIDRESLDLSGMTVTPSVNKEFVVLEAGGSLLYSGGTWDTNYASYFNQDKYTRLLDLIYSVENGTLKGQFVGVENPEKITDVTNPSALAEMIYGPNATPGSLTAEVQKQIQDLDKVGTSYEELDRIIQQYVQSMAAANVAQTRLNNQLMLRQVGVRIDNPWDVWSQMRSLRGGRGQNLPARASGLWDSQTIAVLPGYTKNFWAQSYGNFTEQRTYNGFAGYKSDTWGIATGFDRYLKSGRGLFGFAYGITQNNLETQDWTQLLGTTAAPSSVDTEQHTMIAYGLVRFSPRLYATLKIGGSASLIKGSRRPTPTTLATSATSAASFLVQANAGFNFIERSNWRVSPRVGFSFFGYSQEAYDENIANSNSHVDAYSDNYCEIDILLDGSAWLTDRLSLTSTVGYRRTAGAEGAQLRVTTDGLVFNAIGVDSAKDIFLLDLGANIKMAERLNFVAEYNLRAGNTNVELHGGTATLLFDF